MTNLNLKKALAQKVKAVLATPNWFASSFKQQTDFINDPSRLKAGHCTRRAGKSYGCGIYLCKEAYENPGVSLLYVALTRDSAERILWKDVLKTINRRMNLGAKFIDSELKMVFPNGSVIYLEGADANEAQMNRLLGQKFKLAIIDEASKFRIDVKRLIYDILKPAVADYEGTIAMIGTADNFVSSFFAQITLGKVKGWAVHKWSAVDNPHMKRQFLAEIASLRENNSRVDEEPWFKQNYLGEWVVDDRARIYLYDAETVVRTQPLAGRLTYTLGVSLSYTGKTAFSVIATSPKHREALVVEAFAYEDTNIFRAVETTQDLCARYDITSIKCTEVSKKLVEELRSRFGLPISEATESERGALIRLFSTELAAGHIKVSPNCKPLMYEWDTIIKDDKLGSGTLREHPQSPHHLASATLFSWSMCYNYTYRPPKVYDDPMDAYWDKVLEMNANEQFANDNTGLPF